MARWVETWMFGRALVLKKTSRSPALPAYTIYYHEAARDREIMVS